MYGRVEQNEQRIFVLQDVGPCMKSAYPRPSFQRELFQNANRACSCIPFECTNQRRTVMDVHLPVYIQQH